MALQVIDILVNVVQKEIKAMQDRGEQKVENAIPYLKERERER